jgi:hypothetical protein
MTKIFLEAYDGSTKTYQYEARNISSFNQSVEIPVSVFGLPESSSEAAILTKADGNTERLTFSWTIKDEDTSPVFNGAGSAVASYVRISDSKSFSCTTPDGQYVFIQEVFEKIGIGTNEKHRFLLYDDSNADSLLSKYGIVSRISMSKQSTDPVTWNATIEFTVGDDVTVSG